MIEINLLPPQNILSQKEKEIRFYLCAAVVVLGCLLGLGFGLIFVTDSVLTARLKDLDAKKSSQEKIFQSEIATAEKLQAVEFKVGAITNIIASQKNYPQILSDVIAVIDGSYNIKNLGVSDNNIITAAVVAPNLAAFTKLTDKLAAPDAKFKNVVINGLSQQEDNTINLSLSMIYEN